MQAGLAAVGAGPLERRPDEAHAGARRVVVHLPVGRVEHVDVVAGEELGRGVRAVDHRELPRARQARVGTTGTVTAPTRRRDARCEVQHVAGAQRATAVPAEAAEGERRRGSRGTRARRTRLARAGRSAARAARPRRARASDPARTATGSHDGTGVPSSVAVIAAPVRQTVGVGGEPQRRAGARCTRARRAPRGCRRCGCRAGTSGRPSDRSAARRRATTRPGPGRSCTVVAARRRSRRPSPAAGRCSSSDVGGARRRRGTPATSTNDARKSRLVSMPRDVGARERASCIASTASARVGRVHDDLGEQRVVERRDLGAACAPMCRRAPSAGHARLGDQPGLGPEVLRRDPRRRPAPRWRDPRGRDGRRVASRKLVSPAAARTIHSTRSTPVHRLGHAVLHLEARVHLEEVELAGVDVEHELDGARRPVATRLEQRARRRRRVAARVARVEPGRRRLLEHLLAPALRRAVALAERRPRVPSPSPNTCTSTWRALRDEPLEEHRGGCRTPARSAASPARRRLGEVGRRRCTPACRCRRRRRRSSPAAGSRRRRRPRPRRRRRRTARVPGGQRHAGGRGARRAPRPWRRTGGSAPASGPMNDEAGAPRRAAANVGVLGEEPVARVHRVDVRAPRPRASSASTSQVARRRRPDRSAPRSSARSQCGDAAVDVGEHRDRLDAEAVERADDAARDLAAVGDQDRRSTGRTRQPADHEADRRGIEAVAGVVDLRAVRDHDEHAHVARGARRASPGAEMPSTMPRVPSASTGTFMNQLMLLGHVALAHAAPRVREQEVVDARVLVTGVEAVAQRVRLAAARAADGVVALAGGRGDRHHRPALVGEQLRAGDEEDVPLGHDRVGRAVALGGIVGVVEDAVDRLVALEVDDAQRAARARPRGPTAPAASTTSSWRTVPGHAQRAHGIASARTPRSGGTRARPRVSHDQPASSRVVGPVGPRRDAQRRHRVLGPGIEHVRRVGHDHDHAAARRAARRTRPACDRVADRSASAPSGSTRTPLKKLTLGTMSRAVEPVLRQRHREAVAGVRVVAVHAAVAVLRRVAQPRSTRRTARRGCRRCRR